MAAATPLGPPDPDRKMMMAEAWPAAKCTFHRTNGRRAVKMTNLRAAIASRRLLVGTLVSLSHPSIAEIMATVGFDWLFVDAEHGPLGYGEIQMLLQAAGRCPCLVRIPEVSEAAVKKTLDLGAAGIIAPLVNTAAAAQQIVRWAKYPPLGSRSVGIARAHGYGLRFAEEVARANEETVVVVQIEHVEAVAEIGAILAVAGIDAVLLGPYDLSASLGRPGDIRHPKVGEAIDRVRDACLAAGRPMGIFTTDPDAVAALHAQGFSLIAVGIDAMILGRAARDIYARATERSRIENEAQRRDA